MNVDKNEEIWAEFNVQIENNKIKGCAYTHRFGNENSIFVGVSSYSYNENDERKTNHVPIVTVSSESGSIIHNGEPRDSTNPEKAIQNAINSAEYIFENSDSYNF